MFSCKEDNRRFWLNYVCVVNAVDGSILEAYMIQGWGIILSVMSINADKRCGLSRKYRIYH